VVGIPCFRNSAEEGCIWWLDGVCEFVIVVF
jgi:hypothetical protein